MTNCKTEFPEVVQLLINSQSVEDSKRTLEAFLRALGAVDLKQVASDLIATIHSQRLTLEWGCDETALIYCMQNALDVVAEALGWKLIEEEFKDVFRSQDRELELYHVGDADTLLSEGFLDEDACRELKNLITA
jgi:hypothetical protein